MLDKVRRALPFSTSHWRVDALPSGATAGCATHPFIRSFDLRWEMYSLSPMIMHDLVALLIMIPSDWHRNSAVPEIADDEVSAMTADGATSTFVQASPNDCSRHPEPTPTRVPIARCYPLQHQRGFP